MAALFLSFCVDPPQQNERQSAKSFSPVTRENLRQETDTPEGAKCAEYEALDYKSSDGRIANESWELLRILLGGGVH